MLDLEALVRGNIEINDKVPELIDEESIVKSIVRLIGKDLLLGDILTKTI